MFKFTRGVAALVVLSLAAGPVVASAQSPAAPAAAAHKIKIQEGTEMLIRFDDAISSGKNTEGDQFSISLDDDVKLPDGTVIRSGYRGKGEV